AGRPGLRLGGPGRRGVPRRLPQRRGRRGPAAGQPPGPGGRAAGLRPGQGRLRGALRAGAPPGHGRHPRVRRAAGAQPDAVTATDHGGQVAAAVHALVSGTCRDPHQVLGVHRDGEGVVVRAWRPGASAATLDGRPMRRVHDAGVFEVRLAGAPAPGYRVTYEWEGGGTHTVVEPWSFWPTLGELDLHLIGEGRHQRLWTVLGANHRVHQDVEGTAFAVWAPNARAVRVVGDWNGWDGRAHP